MSGAIFRETLRQTRRQMLYWGVGLSLLGFMIVAILPDVDGLQQMTELLETLPPVLLRAIGVGEDMTFIATPEGWVTVGFFSRMSLLIVFYPVIMGLRVTANEEDSGTMDVLLSLPVERWRVLVEKFAAYTVSSIVIVTLVYISLFVASRLSGIALNPARLAETTFNILPSMILILAFTMLVGTLVRSRRLALGIALAFVFGSFMLNTIGASATGSAADQIRVVSFFRYLESTTVMQSGLVWSNILVLVVLALGMFGISLWAFERRDIGM
jgi:ABC-2 type transport system permease protein